MNIESSPDDPIDPVIPRIPWRGEMPPEEVSEKNRLAAEHLRVSKDILEIEQRHDIERALYSVPDAQQMKLADMLARATIGATELANKTKTAEIKNILTYSKPLLANILVGMSGKSRGEALEYYRAIAEKFLESPDEPRVLKGMAGLNRVLSYAGSFKEALTEPHATIKEKATESGEMFNAFFSALQLLREGKESPVPLEQAKELIDRVALTGNPHLAWIALTRSPQFTKETTREALVQSIVEAGDAAFAARAYHGAIGLNDDQKQRLLELGRNAPGFSF